MKDFIKELYYGNIDPQALTEISAQPKPLKCIFQCRIQALTHLLQTIQSLFLLISNIKTAEVFTLQRLFGYKSIFILYSSSIST